MKLIDQNQLYKQGPSSQLGPTCLCSHFGLIRVESMNLQIIDPNLGK